MARASRQSGRELPGEQTDGEAGEQQHAEDDGQGSEYGVQAGTQALPEPLLGHADTPVLLFYVLKYIRKATAIEST